MQQIVQARSLSRAVVRGVVLSLTTLGMQAAAAGSASANASAGCDAANGGALNVRVSGGASALREAALSEGETLSLDLSTRGTARLAVSSGGGALRTLHAGRASTLMFVAPASATYGFYLDANGAADATLAVTCASVAKLNVERSLLERRKSFLTSKDPDRIRIDRAPAEPKPLDSAVQSSEAPRDVTASISMSELAAAMKLGGKKDPGILDFWFEGRYLTYDTVDANAKPGDGNFSVMYFGSKYMLGPDIMLGALAQFDQAGESSRYGDQISANGWMAGPYMSVRFGPGVVFDGRAAWGVAENAARGVMLDMAPADRKLLRGTLRGSRQVGGWTVAPSVGLSYVQDTPMVDGLAMGETATATPSGTGRLDVLPEVKRRFSLDSETYIEPRLAAGGFLAFDDLSKIGPGSMSSQVPEMQWKAEAGVAVGMKDSVNVQATGGVETGAQSAADTWSGRLQLNMPLGK